MSTQGLRWTCAIICCATVATLSSVRAAPFAYVSNFGSNVITVIDLATNTVVASIPSRSAGFGVAVNSSGTLVYVAHSTANLVAVIDVKRNVVIAEIPVGASPAGVALNPDGTRLFVANGDSLMKIDTTINKSVGVLYVGANPYGVVVNSAGTRVYVAAQGSNQVSVVDAATHVLAATIQTGAGSGPISVALNRDGTRLYVGNVLSGSVAVIDTATNTLVKTISIAGAAINGVAVAPDGTRVWATDGSGRVAVIDAVTDTLITTIPVGGFPVGVALDDSGTRVYVAGVAGNNVAVIDATTRAIVATVTAGSGPTALGQFVTPRQQTAVEFHHAGFDHYFVTAIDAEIQALDSGTTEGWTRTGRSFKVLGIGTPGLSEVCRFFSGESFSPKSSHFYSPFSVECQDTKDNRPQWGFEGNVFAVGLPDAAGGCAPGLSPLFRLYNNGASGAPNHRYTSGRDVRSAMVAQGWASEGTGALGVIGCVVD